MARERPYYSEANEKREIAPDTYVVHEYPDLRCALGCDFVRGLSLYSCMVRGLQLATPQQTFVCTMAMEGDSSISLQLSRFISFFC